MSEALVKDRAALSGKTPWLPRSLRPLSRNMLDVDPPEHTRLRSLVQRAFTPRRVEALRPRIEQLADALINTALRRREVEFIRDIALPIPMTVIADLLDIPESDRPRFHRWSNAIVSVDLSRWCMLKAIPNGLAFIRYIRKLIDKRRSTLGDDLISGLIIAEQEDDRFSADELVAMVFLLLVAGHETTVNLIANGTLALIQHPEQCERLRADAALTASAVEEMLRYYSPVELSTERYASVDMEVSRDHHSAWCVDLRHHRISKSRP